MEKYLKLINGANGLIDNEGNILVAGNQSGSVGCSDGNIIPVKVDDLNGQFLQTFLLQSNLSTDNPVVDLGDLLSPLTVICDQHETSPQR